MKKFYQCKVLITALGFFWGVANVAHASKVPEPFQGHDNSSPYQIAYDDMSALLKAIVLNTGRSHRATVSRGKAKVGTRMKSKRNVFTSLEANRVNYETLSKPENLAVLTKMRESLEKVPSEAPLKYFSTNEQLAYWLNLYNITVLEQVAKLYPQKRIADAMYDSDGVMNQKLLNVAGVPLSLNDIHQKIIIGKFGYTPLVMYGLYQGMIGGPNIRTEAYTGRNVLVQLEDNAEEFINSNRGTFKGKRGLMRLSDFYDKNMALFGGSNERLRDHLLYYANSSYAYAIEEAQKFKADISDDSIGHLTGSERRFGGSANTNTAALLSLENGEGGGGGLDGVTGVNAINMNMIGEEFQDVSSDFSRYSADTLKLLAELKERGEVREGTVTVKESGTDN